MRAVALPTLLLVALLAPPWLARTISECQAANYIARAGVPETVIGTMVCIAKYESSLNPSATNVNGNNSRDWGLWQINSMFWCRDSSFPGRANQCGMSCPDLLDPAANAACAAEVYRKQGLTAWLQCNKHRRECDNYRLSC
jgi:lysozyme